MQVREIMTKDPACCSAQTTIQDIAKMMAECDCGEIPVIDDQRKPVGVVTDRDIACRVVAREKDPRQTAAREVMSSPVVTVTPETSLEDCCQVMEQNQIRRVPVVDKKGACCGVVAQADIALHAPERETAAVVRDVSRPAKAAAQAASQPH